MNKETSYSSSYPENDKSFLKLPKNEISRSINKHMKEIVPENVLKKYIEKKANNYDEYISFRKIFAYQYGAIMALNYILAVDANLYHYIIDLRSGSIPIFDFRLNPNPSKMSPFSVRLSRNILAFLTKTYINAGVLPAMVATADAFSNEDLMMSDYLSCVYEDLPQSSKVKVDFQERILDLKNNFVKVRKVLELAEKIGNQNDIPYQLKFWF
jgi:hypothetical protein